MTDLAVSTDADTMDDSGSNSEPGDQAAGPFATEKQLAAIGLAAVLVSTFFVLRSAGGGIDFSDEGLYLLMVDKPDAAIRTASGFHFLLAPLFDLFGESIVAWRYFRAFLDIGADAVFGVALVGYLRRRFPGELFSRRLPAAALLSGVVAMGFMSWAWSPNGLGYNELASVLATLLAALMLGMLSQPRERSRSVLIRAFAFGALFAPMVVTRWSGAAAIALGVVTVMIVHRGLRSSVVLGAASAAGFAIAAAVIHIGFVNLPDLIDGIRKGTTDVSGGAHSNSKLLTTYARSWRVGLRHGLIMAYVSPLVAGVVYLWRRGRIGPPAVWLVGGLAAMWVTFGGRLLRQPRLGSLNAWATVFASLCLLLLLYQALQAVRTRNLGSIAEAMVVPGVLLCIPFGIAVGTANPIMLNALFAVPLWVGCAVLIVQHNAKNRMLWSLTVGFLFVLGAAAMITTIESMVERPYRIWGDQDQQVERGRFAGLNVDATSRDFLHGLEDIRQDLGENLTVLTFWERPAVAFALDGTGIGFPWYAVTDLEVTSATVEGTCRERVPSFDGPVVIVTEESDPAEFGPLNDALESCGIFFPRDFTFVTALIAPQGETVRVYVSEQP